MYVLQCKSSNCRYLLSQSRFTLQAACCPLLPSSLAPGKCPLTKEALAKENLHILAPTDPDRGPIEVKVPMDEILRSRRHVYVVALEMEIFEGG